MFRLNGAWVCDVEWWLIVGSCEWVVIVGRLWVMIGIILIQ